MSKSAESQRNSEAVPVLSDFRVDRRHGQIDAWFVSHPDVADQVKAHMQTKGPRVTYYWLQTYFDFPYSRKGFIGAAIRAGWYKKGYWPNGEVRSEDSIAYAGHGTIALWFHSHPDAEDQTRQFMQQKGLTVTWEWLRMCLGFPFSRQGLSSHAERMQWYRCHGEC